jgi:hypothetical protein
MRRKAGRSVALPKLRGGGFGWGEVLSGMRNQDVNAPGVLSAAGMPSAALHSKSGKKLETEANEVNEAEKHHLVCGLPYHPHPNELDNTGNRRN